MRFPVFQFVPIASCAFTGYHWEESGSIFSTPSYQVFIHIKTSSLTFLPFRLNITKSLSAVSGYSVLYLLFVLLCCTSSSRFQSSPDPATALKRGLWRSWPVHSSCTEVVQDAVGQLCHQGALLAHGRQAEQDTPPSLHASPARRSAELLFSCSVPSLPGCLPPGLHQ